MKKVRLIKSWLILLGIVLAVPAQAQLNNQSGFNSVHPKLLTNSQELLQFSSSLQDLGTLTEDDAPRTCSFIGKNVSKQTIYIQRVHTTCGCTAAEISQRELKPGDSCEIKLIYTAKNHPGTIDADAFVYLSVSDKQPAARLTLTGKVVPGADEWARFRHSMGTLRLKQDKVRFTEVKKGMKPEERILCGNSGKLPLKITALLIPDFAKLHTEPAVIAPGEEADLVITVDSDKLPLKKQKSLCFQIVLEGVKGKPSDRTIHVEVHTSDK